MTVFFGCIQCHTRTSATAAAFAGSLQLSSSRPGQAVRSVRDGGIDRPSKHKSHPAGSLSSSQPGGLPCWVISLAFNLTFCKYTVTGGFFGFFLFMCVVQHCLICRLSDSTVSKDAGIEPRTIATTALAGRRSNHSDRSYTLSARSHLTVYLTSPLWQGCV
jgi:hypothetical protein